MSQSNQQENKSILYKQNSNYQESKKPVNPGNCMGDKKKIAMPSDSMIELREKTERKRPASR